MVSRRSPSSGEGGRLSQVSSFRRRFPMAGQAGWQAMLRSFSDKRTRNACGSGLGLRFHPFEALCQVWRNSEHHLLAALLLDECASLY